MNIDKIINLIFYIFLAIIGSFHLYQLKFIFDKETSFYQIKNAPYDVKVIINEFRDDSVFYNKDLLKLDSLKIVLTKDKGLWFSGYCDKLSNTLFINKIGRNLRTVIYHELGHCILDYKHKKDDPIMNYKIDISEEVSDDTWSFNKRNFFSQDYSLSLNQINDEIKERIVNNPYVVFFKTKF